LSHCSVGEKNNGKTSSAVKRKYNAKTYKRFIADIKIAEFEEIEKLHGEMSRAQFLRELVKTYKEANNINE